MISEADLKSPASSRAFFSKSSPGAASRPEELFKVLGENSEQLNLDRGSLSAGRAVSLNSDQCSPQNHSP